VKNSPRTLLLSAAVCIWFLASCMLAHAQTTNQPIRKVAEPIPNQYIVVLKDRVKSVSVPRSSTRRRTEIHLSVRS